MKKHIKLIILIIVAVLAMTILSIVYFQMVRENKNFDWGSFSFVNKNKTPQIETAHEFTFDCPIGWKREDNLDYGGRVKPKQCVLSNNKPESVSFEDGVIVSFSFIPNSVVESEKEYFDNKRNTKNNDRVENYSNNGFVGKMYWNSWASGFSIIADIKVIDGYYEVWAWSIVSEKTQNDQEIRKVMIDQIISTFKVPK
ncbi:MAG: hypothetical protein WC389_03910 [Lutibacter sp.]|jgi:hypothetical protein